MRASMVATDNFFTFLISQPTGSIYLLIGPATDSSFSIILSVKSILLRANRLSYLMRPPTTPN